jgi:CheY-like chemotaxis protein
MGGLRCLQSVKSDTRLAEIPVIMLSTTMRKSDEDEFKSLGASDCVVKPSGFNDLVKVLSKYVYK